MLLSSRLVREWVHLVHTIHVRGPTLSVELVSELCAGVERKLGSPARDEAMVSVVVNGRPLGEKRVQVWEQVRRALEDGVEGSLTFELGVSEAAETLLPPGPEDERPTMRAGKPPRSSGTRPRVRPLRVLIVDQEDARRARLVAEFAARGFEAVAVRDGWQALHDLSAHPADVLLAALELYGLTGDELLLRARAQLGTALRASVLIGPSALRGFMRRATAADIVVGMPEELTRVVELVCAALDLAPPDEETGETGSRT